LPLHIIQMHWQHRLRNELKQPKRKILDQP
jgi:hypothetical protein